MTSVCNRRIATATLPHDVHAAFIESASSILGDSRSRSVLTYMMQRSGIDHQYPSAATDGHLQRRYSPAFLSLLFGQAAEWRA
jgi:hypothetical protein